MTTARRQARRRASDAAGHWVTPVLALALALGVPAALRAQTADLRITKTGPSQVASGGTVTVLRTTNLGPSTATNVIVRDTLPPTSTILRPFNSPSPIPHALPLAPMQFT